MGSTRSWSRVLHTEEKLTAIATTIRHLITEQARVLISYNGVELKHCSTFNNWRQHCTANAVEEALRLCQRLGVDQASRLVVSIEYTMQLYKQERKQGHSEEWRYDPLQDPQWETQDPCKLLEGCIVWRSDENIDWRQYGKSRQ